MACYSGYKADEYPKGFTYENTRYEIKEIIDRWYQSDMSPIYPGANYFRIEKEWGKIFLSKHILDEDRWYICMK